jgi:DNA-binding transcriptional ArsR family regulator
MDIEELSQIHKALSVPVRLRILRLISQKSLCVNAITRSLQISQPAVSQHLAVLRRAGLVKGDKQGYMVHYTLSQERLDEFSHAAAGFLKDDAATRISGGKKSRE